MLFLFPFVPFVLFVLLLVARCLRQWQVEIGQNRAPMLL